MITFIWIARVIFIAVALWSIGYIIAARQVNKEMRDHKSKDFENDWRIL